ncbi:MAG: hypothetical protein ACE5I4_08080 [Thermoplasmata archaeon]
MWTTDLGSWVSTKHTPGSSDELVKYVRGEFGEASIGWYLADARRALGARRDIKASQGTLERTQAVAARA